MNRLLDIYKGVILTYFIIFYSFLGGFLGGLLFIVQYFLYICIK